MLLFQSDFFHVGGKPHGGGRSYLDFDYLQLNNKASKFSQLMYRMLSRDICWILLFSPQFTSCSGPFHTASSPGHIVLDIYQILLHLPPAMEFGKKTRLLPEEEEQLNEMGCLGVHGNNPPNHLLINDHCFQCDYNTIQSADLQLTQKTHGHLSNYNLGFSHSFFCDFFLLTECKLINQMVE